MAGFLDAKGIPKRVPRKPCKESQMGRLGTQRLHRHRQCDAGAQHPGVPEDSAIAETAVSLGRRGDCGICPMGSLAHPIDAKNLGGCAKVVSYAPRRIKRYNPRRGFWMG